ADVVTEAAVPFLPRVADEAAHLVEAGGIPRLGHELDAGQRRVRLDVQQHGRVRQHLPRRVAGEDRGEVEAKAVDVHLLDPVTPPVYDHAAPARIVADERVD